jgi:hypothetical protein
MLPEASESTRHHLADDSGTVFGHEYMAQNESFQTGVFTRMARQAEERAASGDGNAAQWLRRASDYRARAAACARSRREYEWRARLQREGW